VYFAKTSFPHINNIENKNTKFKIKKNIIELLEQKEYNWIRYIRKLLKIYGESLKT
jgi:hypothetical protein